MSQSRKRATQAEMDLRLEKMPEIVKLYLEGEVDAKELSAQYGIPIRTLYKEFKALGVTRAKGKKLATAERKIRDAEVNALADEAEKIATIAIGIGGVIARQYLPLINYLLAGGRTLPMIATDVMQWYEMKIPTETRIDELEVALEARDKLISEAWVIAAPNFRYMLRARLVTDFAKRILVARMNGIRIPVRSSIRALQNELAQVDKDIKPLMEKTVE
ncbi:unnamed protein product [marine sediment metagenome]|uniref:HTH psq-type domain-containing protein n=1 Tax=marine sediment metagenome TaxID=412755 RepID=X1CY19_9ZZZZ